MYVHHRRIVNAVAHAVSAATNGHTRVSRTIGPTATAALDPDCLGADAEFDGPLDWGTDVLAAPLPEDLFEPALAPAPALAPDGVPEGAFEAELDPPADADDPLAALEPLVEPPVEVPLKVGGGTAVEGSASAPVPKKTVCPLACSDCVALVVEPSAPAMVKRVVHWKSVPGALN